MGQGGTIRGFLSKEGFSLSPHFFFHLLMLEKRALKNWPAVFKSFNHPPAAIPVFLKRSSYPMNPHHFFSTKTGMIAKD
ncbi:hypothetical protein BGS_1294 [Beggiatoa sp. SS]|nr:hypothetical protein BGS_1294 [Beggiatoa sp. SS]